MYSEEKEKEGDETSESKKRQREEQEAVEQQEADDKKNRGNYRCSKCNLPKKGHVCPYQPRFRRRDAAPEGTQRDMEIQVELDPEMTIRTLQLDKQGLPESYMAIRSVSYEPPPEISVKESNDS